MKKTDFILDLKCKNSKLLEEINDIKENIYLIKSPHYEFGLEKVYEIKDIEKLKILKLLFCNKNLIWSNHYEYTINKLINISNTKRLKKLIELSLNIDLLNSNHYKFVIESACSAKNMLFLNAYIIILTDNSLLNSKCYKSLVDKLICLKNFEINDLVIRILDIINEFENTVEIFESLCKILNKNNKLYINYLLNVFIVKLQNSVENNYIKKLKKPSI